MLLTQLVVVLLDLKLGKKCSHPEKVAVLPYFCFETRQKLIRNKKGLSKFINNSKFGVNVMILCFRTDKSQTAPRGAV